MTDRKPRLHTSQDWTVMGHTGVRAPSVYVSTYLPKLFESNQLKPKNNPVYKYLDRFGLVSQHECNKTRLR